MIYYLVARRHAPSMGAFLTGLGRGLANRIRVLPYEDLFSGAAMRLPVGTYIFTSLGADLGERNPPSRERGLIGDLHRKLVDVCGPARVLNDPLKFMSRFELLRELEQRGINHFAAYRVNGAEAPKRFPVFLREEFGTLWQVPPLLRDGAEYAAAVRNARKDRPLIAVEYRDTADAAGIYRKYGCFIVGDRLVPRHLFFSRNWWVKEADVAEPAALEEEMHFLESNPHERILKEVFRMSNISYGRIDYAVVDGQPQVWEINITPSIATAISSKIGARHAVNEKFMALFSSALDALDPPTA